MTTTITLKGSTLFISNGVKSLRLDFYMPSVAKEFQFNLEAKLQEPACLLGFENMFGLGSMQQNIDDTRISKVYKNYTTDIEQYWLDEEHDYAKGNTSWAVYEDYRNGEILIEEYPNCRLPEIEGAQWHDWDPRDNV